MTRLYRDDSVSKRVIHYLVDHAKGYCHASVKILKVSPSYIVIQCHTLSAGRSTARWQLCYREENRSPRRRCMCVCVCVGEGGGGGGVGGGGWHSRCPFVGGCWNGSLNVDGSLCFQLL